MPARYLVRAGRGPENHGMLHLRPNSGSSDADVWSASAVLHNDADEVLRALTRPDSIAQWAPVRFDVDGLAGNRLRAGSCERVRGSIAGITATFDVEVTRADSGRLELVARGPVALDVAYSFSEHHDGVIVNAQVGVRRGRGLTSQVLRAAVGALLNAGALGSALRRLESSLSYTREPGLVVA
jgi:hypothetical protein